VHFDRGRPSWNLELEVDSRRTISSKAAGARPLNQALCEKLRTVLCDFLMAVAAESSADRNDGSAPNAGKSGAKVRKSLDAQEVESRKRTFRQRKLSITAGNAAFSDMVDDILKDTDADAEDGELYMSREMTGKGGVGRAGLASDESLPFPVSMCGTYSCHGIEPRYTHHGVAIKSKINQDRVSSVFRIFDSFSLFHFSRVVVCLSYDPSC
jgi:hypothetical protein